LKVKRERKDSKISQVLKWVGYVAAILSLCATLAGFAKYVYDRAETARNVTALLTTASEQKKARDYSSGWQTLEKAAQLDANSAKVEAARENLAMAWLDDIHLQENQSFSDVAQKLEPILTQAVAATKPGPQQADLRAHLGWAYFLESRDGRSDLDPVRHYREAAAENSNNPYAEAMWGHWILWQHCDRIKEAAGHFSAALASRRDGDFVRHLEMAALLNCHDEQSDLEVIRVANAMREEHRLPDDGQRDHILLIYYGRLLPDANHAAEFVNAIPPSEHVATFRWLFDGLDSDGSNRWLRAYYLAVLDEAAGQREDAIVNYHLVLDHMPSHTSAAWQGADVALKRLSQQAGHSPQ
jgi:hypothetical protein